MVLKWVYVGGVNGVMEIVGGSVLEEWVDVVEMFLMMLGE